MRLSGLKKLDDTIHWEHTKKVSAAQSYCMKEDTRTGEQWIFGYTLPQPLIKDEIYGWQLQALSLIKGKPERRTINWIWEPEGNKGKSAFVRYVFMTCNTCILSGKANDMFYSIACKKPTPEIVLIDIPRSNIGFVNYGAIEQVKNGLFFYGKYKSKSVRMNPPHIIIFANTPPDRTTMSEDRWHVYEIIGNELIEHNSSDIDEL